MYCAKSPITIKEPSIHRAKRSFWVGGECVPETSVSCNCFFDRGRLRGKATMSGGKRYAKENISAKHQRISQHGTSYLVRDLQEGKGSASTNPIIVSNKHGSAALGAQVLPNVDYLALTSNMIAAFQNDRLSPCPCPHPQGKGKRRLATNFNP